MTNPLEIKNITDNARLLIDINEFNEIPGPNCMSFGFDIEQLAHSIETFGLINPPIISRNREGRPEIITGYRRIMALKALNSPDIPCIDISRLRLSPLEQLLLNLSDNLITRRFNNIEKSMILNRLNEHIQRKELEVKYMPLLDISNRKEIDTLLRIDGFDIRTKEYIAKGNLSLKTVELLLDIDIRSRSIILQWVIDLRFNLNQQLKYIDYLIDISIKENTPVHTILSRADYVRVYQDMNLNKPQKVKKILGLLKTRRYPLLSDCEKKFSRKISALKLPDNVRIEHSPFFESEDYSLEITFKTGKDLKDKIDTLANIQGFEDLEEPWKV